MFRIITNRATKFSIVKDHRKRQFLNVCTKKYASHHQQQIPSLSQIFRLEYFHTTTKAPQQHTGELIYQQALQAMEDAKALEAQKEQERSKQMYEAWKKSQEAQNNPKTQGVKVVKTLVKETRKEQKSKKDGMDEAIELLEKAAYEHEHPEALVQLGNLALQNASKKGNDPAEMISKAIKLFERAGLAGSRVGWYNLGQLYWTGYPTVEELVENDDESFPSAPTEPQIMKPDLHEAMDYFLKAIDLGDCDAMYLVGVHRMTLGGKENIQSGLSLVKKAADEGHNGAMYYVALLSLNGQREIGLEPCSLEKFMELLDRAVEAGNPDARFTRGHSFYHGTEGYPQSYEKALNDFIIAAEDGHADSAVSAGAMLHSGIGVTKDQRRAFEFYQLAGELGSKEGWQNVVACYTTGEGVPQSLETAKYIRETMLKED